MGRQITSNNKYIPGENHRAKKTTARQAVKHLARHIANILPPVVRPVECSAASFLARPFVCYTLTNIHMYISVFV